MPTKQGLALASTATAAAAEIGMIHLGRTYGSTKEERRAHLPGDDIIPDPGVQTDHAVTIDAPPSAVWPWVAQMGWGRAGWYTARWVDRLLFPSLARHQAARRGSRARVAALLLAVFDLWPTTRQ